MKINGIELEDLDMFDLDTAAKVESAIDKLEKSEKENVIDSSKLSEVIKQRCSLIFDFFNDIWGKGTDVKVFGGKSNIKKCYKAFEEVLLEIDKSKKESETMFSKYSPNRVARRSKK